MAKTAPYFRPIVDGYFLPDTVPNIYADGKQAHIALPRRLGRQRGRPRLFAAAPDTFIAQARTRFGPNADKYLLALSHSHHRRSHPLGRDYASDQFIALLYLGVGWRRRPRPGTRARLPLLLRAPLTRRPQPPSRLRRIPLRTDIDTSSARSTPAPAWPSARKTAPLSELMQAVHGPTSPSRRPATQWPWHSQVARLRPPANYPSCASTPPPPHSPTPSAPLPLPRLRLGQPRR